MSDSSRELERLDLLFSSDCLAEGALAGNVLPLTITLNLEP